MRRLRLVRALVEVAEMRLDAVRAVLAAVDDESRSLHEVLGAATSRLPDPRPDQPADPAVLARVDALLRRWRWQAPSESSQRLVLARALEALDGLGQPLGEETLDRYAEAMRSVAEREVAGVPAEGAERAIEYVVTGTLLAEPVLLSLRRLAHADLSRRRLGRRRRRS